MGIQSLLFEIVFNNDKVLVFVFTCTLLERTWHS